MKSWAVTRGPSLGDRPNKRLAVQVEDHPVSYNKFEGSIPKGEYGGGTVMIWDRGRWRPRGDPRQGLAQGGDLSSLYSTARSCMAFGTWCRLRKKPGEKRNNWLLIKADDAAARAADDKDILQQKPRSVVSGRTMQQIAVGAPKKPARKTKPATAQPARMRAAVKRSAPAGKSAASKNQVSVAGISLSHPDRVYWDDAGISKRELAEFYAGIWGWMRPHVVGRPISLLRCPQGANGQCFFQKHAACEIATAHLHLVAEKGDKIIAIDDLSGLIALVQAGVLEVHTRGTTIEDRARADRLVFDLDPGPGTGWRDVVAAAREVRARLTALKLKSFVKTSGGKGLHVVLPIKSAPWDTTKDFCHALAASMAADVPARYTATAAKSKRRNRIFIDYLRNSREATAIAPYSTRARPGAPVSTPIEWSEIGALQGANQYTMRNLPARLARLRADPWAGIGRLKPSLPKLPT